MCVHTHMQMFGFVALEQCKVGIYILNPLLAMYSQQCTNKNTVHPILPCNFCPHPQEP